MVSTTECKEFFNSEIISLEKQINIIKQQQDLIEQVGINAAVVGDFTSGVEYLQVVSIGDTVCTKSGSIGVITDFDFQHYNKNGQLFSIKITFLKDCGTLETESADRCN